MRCIIGGAPLRSIVSRLRHDAHRSQSSRRLEGGSINTNMKMRILTIIPAIGLLSSPIAQAQSTVYSSNLGYTPTGSFAVASNSLIAQEFVWEGYTVNGEVLTPNCILNSVQLRMDAASGNPSGFTVSIYTVGSSGPGTSLGTLTGDPNPYNPGVYTYTTPGITLYPATSYFVVVGSATPSAQGAYHWDSTASYGQIDSQGLKINNVINYLMIDDVYRDSADGLNWNFHVRGDIAQMAIYGTPVPEPSLLAFGLTALVVGGLVRRTKVVCRRTSSQLDVVR